MAPLGTTNVIVLLLTIVNGIEVLPFNDKEVALLKLLPTTVTVVPIGPDDGLKELIIGGVGT